MFALYSTLLFLALLVTLPYWLLQMLRLGKYRAGLRERLGSVPRRIRTGDTRPVIWIHAVSVGEVLAVGGLVRMLRESRPDYRVVISTTTHTGQKLARERFGEHDVFYFPIDLGMAISPYIKQLRPALVVLAETEFWPNFLRKVHLSGAQIAVVNARISDHSFPRYRRFRGLLSKVLAYVNLFLAQSEEDARRLREIGAPEERIHISGNLKFDVKPPEEVKVVAQLREMLTHAAAGPVIVAGSTVPGQVQSADKTFIDEEELLLDTFAEVLETYPRAVLILAPRHKERFEAITGLLATTSFPVVLRSKLSPKDRLSGSVLLLDSLGELASIYALADVAFVGGSMALKGGHNILEPANWGVATIVGPHTENFRDIISIFRQARAVLIAQPDTFTEIVIALLGDKPERLGFGQRAFQVIAEQTGATERTVTQLSNLLGGGFA